MTAQPMHQMPKLDRRTLASLRDAELEAELTVAAMSWRRPSRFDALLTERRRRRATPQRCTAEQFPRKVAHATEPIRRQSDKMYAQKVGHSRCL